jgi:hypothetical protein
MSSQASFSHARQQIGDFEIHTLSDGASVFSVVPELGGRVVSITAPASGREWLDGWSPAAARRLARPADPADFATGPGAGLDECLPTVLPCAAAGAVLADHGELWNQPVAVVVDPARRSLRCRWSLRSLPLGFEREISLVPGGLRFAYQIENLAARPTPYQWAWHPLFSFEPGDELSFAPQPTSCCDPQGTVLPWPASHPGCDLSRADLRGVEPQCAKVFVGPLETACVRIRSAAGPWLGLEWPVEWAPYAGVWITRGGWRGLHHWAVEPTNIPLDRLADGLLRPDLRRLVMLQPGETRSWQVTVTLG